MRPAAAVPPTQPNDARPLVRSHSRRVPRRPPVDRVSASKNRNTTLPQGESNFIDSLIGVSAFKTDIVNMNGDNKLNAERDGDQIFGSLKIRTTINTNQFKFTPTAKIDLGYTLLSEYTEKGSDALKLKFDEQKIKTVITSVGMIFDNSIDIERGAQEVVVTIHTARPGIIIGRGGTAVDVMREDMETLTGKKARLNILEVRQPDLNAILVGRSISEQLVRRVAYRRAIRTAAQRTMQSGALGIKILVSGRLGGAEIARSDKYMEGRVPLHTLRAQIDYAVAEAFTTYGVVGVKVWIYTGDMSMSSESLMARTQSRATMSKAPEENKDKKRSKSRRRSKKKDSTDVTT